MFKIDKFLVSATELFISVFFLYGINLAYVKKFNLKIANFIIHTGFILGITAGFIEFIMKTKNAKQVNISLIKLNRYLILSIALFSIICVVFCILKLIFKNLNIKSLNYISSVFLSITLFLSFFYISPVAFKSMGEFVYFGEDTLSTMALLRAIGFFLGLLLCVLTGYSINKLSKYMNKKSVLVFLTLSLIVYGLDFSIKSVSAMQRLKIIKLNDFIFNIMIFGDKNYKYLYYALLFVAIMMLIYSYIKNMNVVGEFKNNAMFRKAKAKTRKAKRSSILLFLCVFTLIFNLTVVNYYAHKEPELAKPQSYEIKENKIIIYFEDVEDGKLHRFSYKTPNGYDVRFIAVKKPMGSSFGLGLDACEICGLAGYYERGEDVICKMCDVVMNKNTIGFKGGCNPIPFPYTVENSMIIIDIDDLIREEKRFK